MKTIAPAALTALDNGTAIVVGAVEIMCDPPIRIWGGNGPITLAGNVFDPVGDRGLVKVMGGALGGAATGVTLSLSGIDPDIIEIDDSDEVAGAPTALWRLIFAGDGITLLDAQIWQRGRLDQLTREDEIGGTATFTAQLETAARGLGRSGARIRSDADQRLIKANDGFFKHTSYAGEKTLYWGGRKPQNASSALGATVVGGGSGGGGGKSYNSFLDKLD